MYEAEFELEALTPIFMRGADQTNAEIRSSSIKGLMRWWFRALAGNYFGDNITGLREAEAYVFGSTGHRSRVVVEIIEKDIKEGLYPLPMVWRKKKGGIITRIFQKAIAPKSKFILLLTSENEDILKLSSYSLIGLTYFGGIGFRHSRGAGSLKISRLKSDVQLMSLPKDKHQLIHMISDLTISTAKILKKLSISKFKEQKDISCTNYSSFRCFYMFLWNEKDKLEDVYYKSSNLDDKKSLNLLDLFEKEFKNKSNHSSNYGYYDFVFGLPRGPKKDRRASPMRVGILELSGKYHVKVLVFKTKAFKPGMNAKWDNIFKFLEKIGAEKIYPR